MADSSDGRDKLKKAHLPGPMTLDSLVESEQMAGNTSLVEESDANILGGILEMEGTEADFKDDASIMKALAECGENIEGEDPDYETENDEEEDEEDGDEDEEDEDNESESKDEDSEEEDEEEEEEGPGNSNEDGMDFGEMPDFSSMMEAEGSSLLEEAVATDLEITPVQESEFADKDADDLIKVKTEPGTSGEKAVSPKKTSRKRKRKSDGKEKSDTKKATKGKKRKKKMKSEESSKADSSKLKPSERRRNIRKIIGEKDLDKETLDAQKEEFERQQRLMELKRQAMSNMASAAASKPSTAASSAATSASSAAAKEQDSQLKSLLQSAEEEAEKHNKKWEAEKHEKKKAETSIAVEIKKEPCIKEEKVDVIELSSDSEAQSDDDDCVMVQSSEEEERDQEVESEDLNDGGAHINDEFNCPDDKGRVLVNVGHPSDDPDIFLSPQMARAIKPHQIGGVRFLYDNLVESLPRFNSSQGFGCILAHSMGLGKTIQVISFIDIFLRHTTAKKVLCIVPINTLQNWMAEFNMWAPSKEKPAPLKPPLPPKPKDSEKKTKEKKPRDRSKKNKGGKAGGRGQSPAGGPFGSELGSVGGVRMGQPEGFGIPHIGGPDMGNQGISQFGRPGQPHMGDGMNQMGSAGMGQMAGPGMPQMGHMGHGVRMQGMNINHLGGSGGSFTGMPWMGSSVQQQFNSMPSSSPSPSVSQSASNGPQANPVGTSVSGNSVSQSYNCASPQNPVSASFGNMSMSGCNSTVGQIAGSENLAGTPAQGIQMGLVHQSSSSSGGLMGSSVNPPYFENPASSVSLDSLSQYSGNGTCQGSMENSNGGPPMGFGIGKYSGGGLSTPMDNNFGNMANSATDSMDFIDDLMGITPTLGPAGVVPSTSAELPMNSSTMGTMPTNTLPATTPSLTGSGSMPVDSSGTQPLPSSVDAKSASTAPSSGAHSPQEARPTEESKSDTNKETAGAEKENSDVKKEEEKEVCDDEIMREKGDTRETRYRNYRIFLLNDSCKATAQRAKIIEEWNAAGGVLLLGYEMYRLLSNKRSYMIKPKKKKKAGAGKDHHPDIIDVEEDSKNEILMTDIHGALVNPGPDLVICDEGHRIKNNHASISQALKQIRTRRRVVLTGYPLQNNLMEYWCMVDFVRPNFLGNKTEFSNMFERPIMNGQCQDSTPDDVRIMKHRAYVLHNLLEGFVQRRSHIVLQQALPPKLEFVFLVRMSPIQRKLYRRYIDSLEEAASLIPASSNPLKAFAVGCKIWNHPDILHKSVVLKKPVVEDNDLDIDGEAGSGKKKIKKTESSSSLASTASVSSMASVASSATGVSSAASALNALNVDTPSPFGSSTADMTENSAMSWQSSSEAGPGGSESGTSSAVGTSETGAGVGLGENGRGTPMMDKKEDENAWVGDAFEGYEPGILEHGPKMVLLKTLIEESLSVGDKILVFSQSLSTLDTIEEFFSKRKVPRPDMSENWTKNASYFRLDGSTSGTERERLINEFNNPNNQSVWMFLLSTKAGCLGINLIGANRVVVLDASWNPCHDCQAVCRVFRFGQKKQSYIYRLVTENTLERNIYDRQITKQGMSDRVVDEMNPDNHFSRRQLENLLKNEDKDFPYVDFSTCEDNIDDPVTISTLKKQGQWITKEPFTHESLLIDRKELRMSRKEKQQAKEGYARDKRMNITYSRPSYAAYYPGASAASPMYIRRSPRPIPNVRPMMSTPVPRPATQMIKPGVSVHQVITTTDILLPGTNTATPSGAVDPNNKIAAGQKILVIKTPKGVYIRTSDGKMFAVRSKLGESGDGGDGEGALSSAVSLGGGASTTTTMTASSVSSGTRSTFSAPHPGLMYNSRDRQLQRSMYNMMDRASLMSSMYSQKGRSKRQFAPTLPAAHMKTAHKTHPGMFAGSRGAKLQADLLARSAEVSAMLRNRAAMASGSHMFNAQPSQAGPSASPLMRNPLPDRAKDSHMMKLLASEEEGEKVGRSATMGLGSEVEEAGKNERAFASFGLTSNDRPLTPEGSDTDSNAAQSGALQLPFSPSFPFGESDEDESSQGSSWSNSSFPPQGLQGTLLPGQRGILGHPGSPSEQSSRSPPSLAFSDSQDSSRPHSGQKGFSSQSLSQSLDFQSVMGGQLPQRALSKHQLAMRKQSSQPSLRDLPSQSPDSLSLQQLSEETFGGQSQRQFQRSHIHQHPAFRMSPSLPDHSPHSQPLLDRQLLPGQLLQQEEQGSPFSYSHSESAESEDMMASPGPFSSEETSLQAGQMADKGEDSEPAIPSVGHSPHGRLVNSLYSRKTPRTLTAPVYNKQQYSKLPAPLPAPSHPGVNPSLHHLLNRTTGRPAGGQQLVLGSGSNTAMSPYLSHSSTVDPGSPALYQHQVGGVTSGKDSVSVVDQNAGLSESYPFQLGALDGLLPHGLLGDGSSDGTSSPGVYDDGGHSSDGSRLLLGESPDGSVGQRLQSKFTGIRMRDDTGTDGRTVASGNILGNAGWMGNGSESRAEGSGRVMVLNTGMKLVPHTSNTSSSVSGLTMEGSSWQPTLNSLGDFTSSGMISQNHPVQTTFSASVPANPLPALDMDAIFGTHSPSSGFPHLPPSAGGS